MINQIEACSLIAERILQSIFTEEEIYIETEDGTSYSEIAQEKFNEIYDYLRDDVCIETKCIVLNFTNTSYNTEGFLDIFPDYDFSNTSECAIWTKKKQLNL